MSCSFLVRLSPLFAAALSFAEAEPARCDLNEAQCLLQGEVHVTRLGPGSYEAGAEPEGDSPLASRLRDKIDHLGPSPSTSVGPSTSASPSTSTDDSAQWQKALSLEVNKQGDLAVLGLSFATNGCALLVCLMLVGLFRKIYPQIYENNARSFEEGGFDTAPFHPESHCFGWVAASLRVSQDEMRECVGVDEMLLIEFANFGMRLLFLLGVPLVCVLCPIHLFLGSGKVDRLSTIGMANMPMGSPVIWVHVCMIWYVVLVTEQQVHRAMHKFLDVRVRWLLELEPPRSTTVLLEGIPENRRSDKELKAYFDMLFPNCIESVYIVKNTRRLSKLVKTREHCRLRLEQAMFEWQQNGEDPNRRPTFYHWLFMRLCGGVVVKQNDKIEYYKEQLSKAEASAEAERQLVIEASADPMIEEEDASGRTIKTLTERARAVNAHTGFVTFTSEREARLMLGMRCTASFEEWIPHVPPQCEDVIYEDLQVQLNTMKVLHLVGYTFVVGVFFSFLPLICGVGTLASFEAFTRHFDINTGLQPKAALVFEGVVASLALTTFTSFLPTILMLVFSSFFVLRAGAWAQLKLQTWLFWFNLIFVVLVTSLGGTLVGRIRELVERPLSCLTLLADSLPHFTHFYLNFMLMQWVIHALNLTRYIQLIKYWIWRAVVGPERAVVLTEPEDQDYYGIGSRSAQWTINLVIGIVFCTLTPLITIFTFINFFITRVVYGYLVVFAETRKPDLGGPFFVTQLWHVQYGLLVYAALMIGVTWHHSNHNSAMLMVVTPTLVYILFGFYHFYTHYQWEALPFEELCTEEAIEDFQEELRRYRALGKDRPCYTQQELLKEDEEEAFPQSPNLRILQEKGTKAAMRRSSTCFTDQMTAVVSADGMAARRKMRGVHVDAMVGRGEGLTTGVRGAVGAADARASVVLDVGLDFVNRHFTEWGGNGNSQEGGRVGFRRSSTNAFGSQEDTGRQGVTRPRTPGSSQDSRRASLLRAQTSAFAGSPSGQAHSKRRHLSDVSEGSSSDDASDDDEMGISQQITSVQTEWTFSSEEPRASDDTQVGKAKTMTT